MSNSSQADWAPFWTSFQASALEWPGWARSGKTLESAIDNLLAYAPRYQPVVRAAGLTLGSSFDVDVVEELPGGGGTEFGVPSLPTAADARPADEAEAGQRSGE